MVLENLKSYEHLILERNAIIVHPRSAIGVSDMLRELEAWCVRNNLVLMITDARIVVEPKECKDEK